MVYKKKIRLKLFEMRNLFIVLVMVGVSTMTGLGQSVGKYGATPEDSITCRQNLSLYNESYKQKHYTDAMPGWRWVFTNCPKSSKKMYSDGENMYKKLMRAEKTPETKDKLLDTLLMIYDQRIQHFGQEGFVLGRKGVVMVQYRKEKYEDAFSILKQSVETEGLKSKAGAITGYFQSSLRMLENGKIEKEKVIEIFGEVSEIADHQLGKLTDEKKKGAYISAKENIEKLFEPIASCEDLIPMYSKKFDLNKENATWLKRGTELMNKKGCTDAPVFISMAETLHHLDPSAESAYNMGKMMLGKSQNDKATTYLKQAVELQENTEKKADYLITLANHCFKNLKQPGQGRSHALKAASVKPGWGNPYIVIGDMYAASAKSCGSNDFEKSAVYWAAVDKYIRAKSVDAAVSEDANKKIATFSKYFPNQKDAFFYDYTDGKPYTIGCWINETTKVRVQQ